MPDTKIERRLSGWVDVDQPYVMYRTRREARDARRHVPTPLQAPVPARSATTVRMFGARLRKRVLASGATTSEVSELFATGLGYNACASYAHMRTAGATHAEALSVVQLGKPGVSLLYGQARQQGKNHADALGVTA